MNARGPGAARSHQEAADRSRRDDGTARIRQRRKIPASLQPGERADIAPPGLASRPGPIITLSYVIDEAHFADGHLDS